MSDSDFDVDSEEELQELRKIRQVMECDDDSSLLCPGTTTNKQQQQVIEALRKSALHFVNLSLALNKQMDAKMVQLEKTVERSYKDCMDKLKRIRGQHDSESNRSESFRYINCGRPYFKDKENFAAPDNDDTLIMAKNHMYDFSNITSVPGWTMRDKTQLWNQIEKMTKAMKRRELVSTIAALKRDSKNKSFSGRITVEKQITKIKKELGKLSNKKLDDLALPIDEEYDWEEVTHSLDRRHSATEYRSLWKLYLHPSVNKTNWSKAEHQLLQKVAYEHELHDWEQIAEDMGNNRTGYQCFVYFRTNMNNTFTGKKWSDEEVDYLLRLIEYYKEDHYIPWVKVAALMENRTKIQIYNKYTRLLEQRKGRFLAEEDTVILTCADDFGPNFRKMAQFLPGRSVAQIRVRYQALSKKRVSAVWTVEEDRKLLQLLSNQDTAANYASITKYFPGKDRIHIRARYVTLVKWMRRNPNADIIKAPRRGARRLGHGKASENLNVAIESLKTRIQTEANKKKTNRINSESTEDAIEDSIIATLVNENICNERIRNDSYDADQLSILENDSNIVFDAVHEGNLQKILLILRAKLNKNLFEKRYIENNKSRLSSQGDQTCVVKVKSYSKQNTIKSIELNAPADVWGNHTFKALEYVLPPNYATITGCRKLMTFVATKQNIDDDFLNFSIMGRRNIILREQLDILMERFNTLFLWPLLLSNDGPKLDQIQSTEVRFNPKNCTAVAKELALSRDRDSDNSEVDIYETGDGNVTVDIVSETEDNEGNVNECGEKNAMKNNPNNHT